MPAHESFFNALGRLTSAGADLEFHLAAALLGWTPRVAGAPLAEDVRRFQVSRVIRELGSVLSSDQEAADHVSRAKELTKQRNKWVHGPIARGVVNRWGRALVASIRNPDIWEPNEPLPTDERLTELAEELDLESNWWAAFITRHALFPLGAGSS